MFKVKKPPIYKGENEQSPNEMNMAYGGFTPDWKEHLNGYMDEHFNKQTNAIPQMAQGGYTPEQQSAEENMLTGQGFGDTPPPPAFNPQNGLPPQVPAAPVPEPPVAYPSAAENMAATTQYSPEKQMAVEQEILKNRQGFGSNLARGAGGFADAIMQGVARAGPSNFQANITNQQNSQDEGYRNAMKNAQTGKMSQIKQQMELAQMDPESPISKTAQRSAMPTLLSMGLSQDEISAMPASLISQATTQRLSLEEIRSKAEETRALREQNALLQNESLRLRGGAERETARHARVEEGIAKGAKQGEAAKTLAGRGLFQTAVNMIPFTAGHAATKVLQKQAEGEPETGHGIPDLGSTFNGETVKAVKKIR